MYKKSYKSCKHCNRDIVSSRHNDHETKCLAMQAKKAELALKTSGHQKGNPAWNKGLTKETDSRVLENSIALSNATKGRPGRLHSDETKRKLSQKASVNNKGGRCKWFEVASQKVQGKWEQNVALKFEELHIKWVKLKTNQYTFEYTMDDKIRSYTPDFYLPDYDIYLEIKGRWWGRDKEKMNLVLEKYKDKKIIVIEKDNYEKILRGELVW